MNRYARLGVFAATLAGLAAATWAYGSTGIAGVGAVVARLGGGGFLLFCGWSIGTFALLGAAWLAVAPGEPAARLPLFSWARMVREAVSDLLPFSHFGGIVVSARTLTQARVPSAIVYGSLLADIVTEMASQLVITLIGLGLAVSTLAGPEAARLLPLILGGTGAMAAVMLAFFLAQRRGLGLVGNLAGRLIPGSAAALDDVDAARAAIFGNWRRLAAAFGLNLLAWGATTAGAWGVLALMGARLPYAAVLSLEVLIFTLRSVAFAVPGAIGFQEAGYALAGPLFGLPAEAALALSLAKRARDLSLGLPTLVAWQIAEGRALVGTSGRQGAPRSR